MAVEAFSDVFKLRTTLQLLSRSKLKNKRTKNVESNGVFFSRIAAYFFFLKGRHDFNAEPFSKMSKLTCSYYVHPTLRMFAVTFPYRFQSIQITNCTLTCSDLSVISTF